MNKRTRRSIGIAACIALSLGLGGCGGSGSTGGGDGLVRTAAVDMSALSLQALEEAMPPMPEGCIPMRSLGPDADPWLVGALYSQCDGGLMSIGAFETEAKAQEFVRAEHASSVPPTGLPSEVAEVVPPGTVCDLSDLDTNGGGAQSCLLLVGRFLLYFNAAHSETRTVFPAERGVAYLLDRVESAGG